MVWRGRPGRRGLIGCVGTGGGLQQYQEWHQHQWGHGHVHN